MSTPIPEASLLGLPTELRLRIYDYALDSDVDCKVIRNISHSSDSNGTQATLIPMTDVDLCSSVPWLNLQQTCRFIATEMRSYMTGPFSEKNDRHRTYVLDLEVHNNLVGEPIRSATWRRLPCAPAHAQTIVFNVITRSGSGPWTDGGPASLARALYQLLNHIMHLGPRIIRTRLLPDHLKIRDLRINVDIGVYTHPPASGCNTDPIFNWHLLHGGWQQISRTGFLSDYVEITTLRNQDGEEVKVPTEWQQLPALPGYWRGYGFQWGINVAGYRTL